MQIAQTPDCSMFTLTCMTYNQPRRHCDLDVQVKDQGTYEPCITNKMMIIAMTHALSSFNYISDIY